MKTFAIKQSVEVARCTGHCCKIFSIQNHTKATYMEVIKKLPNYKDEIEIFEEMLIELPPLEGDALVEYLVECGKDEEYINANKDRAEKIFACKFISKRGDCTNYEKRPRMCRDYPEYGRDGVCGYKDCTRVVKIIEHEAIEV